MKKAIEEIKNEIRRLVFELEGCGRLVKAAAAGEDPRDYCESCEEEECWFCYALRDEEEGVLNESTRKLERIRALQQLLQLLQ